jgi:acyl carrier protein
MKNIEKYKKAFTDSLSLDNQIKLEKLEYQSIPEWDSIGHMTLMSELENTFDISIDTDDIVDFGSFKKGKDILKKYKVIF